MRSFLLTISGLVLGAAVGGTIANLTIPSHEQMREFAANLVPPGTQTTDVSEVTGVEMFVGQYEAIAGFDTQGEEVATVAAALRNHAVELGWTHIRTEPKAGGEQQYWTREGLRATVSIFNPELSEDSVVFVRHAASEVDRFLIGLALGAAAGLLLALVPRFVLRRSPAAT